MEQANFTENDLHHLNALGISEDQVGFQLSLLRNDSSFLALDRPCTIGDGIVTIPEARVQSLIEKQQEAVHHGRATKFVPASGAATRMFKALMTYSSRHGRVIRTEVEQEAQAGDSEAQIVLEFIDDFTSFAFFKELSAVMKRNGLNIDTHVTDGNFTAITEYLLTEKGLNYAALPKGLLAFHAYSGEARTAAEEHLVEAAQYVRDKHSVCRLHFTISPEHKNVFHQLVDSVGSHYEQAYGVQYDISFSVQKPSTDTIASDLHGRPFRDSNGKLLFRPGGHGALIKNLNDLKADLIYIKNIDNVAPDHLKDDTIFWKRIIGGYLVEVQEHIFSYLQRLEAGDTTPAFLDDALSFAKKTLHLTPSANESLATDREKKSFLQQKLNRPIRVCGVVQNVGEPGGGPFWIKSDDGSFTLQIVESAQVNMGAKSQNAIWNSATHFNPVDLVCGVRDFQGKPFDLTRFIDHKAVFISRKSKDGRELKALELPGLWNGAMAHWNTIFIQVPITTFNPVKKVTDLLRKEHQPA